MTETRPPITGTLYVESSPSSDTFEIPADDWEAMTPAERNALLNELSATHMTNAGGYGYNLDDPDREADLEDTELTEREALTARVTLLEDALAQAERDKTSLFDEAKRRQREAAQLRASLAAEHEFLAMLPEQIEQAINAYGVDAISAAGIVGSFHNWVHDHLNATPAVSRPATAEAVPDA